MNHLTYAENNGDHWHANSWNYVRQVHCRHCNIVRGQCFLRIWLKSYVKYSKPLKQLIQLALCSGELHIKQWIRQQIRIYLFFKFEGPSLRVILNTWWSVCALLVRLRWKVIVRFVNIGGIDDHHCLNCLLIINKWASDYSQIYGIWLPLWYLQTLPNKSRNLNIYQKQMLFKLNRFP